MRSFRQNSFQSAAVVGRHVISTRNRVTSRQTVSPVVGSATLHSYRPYRGQVLVARHCQNCLNWTRAHRQWCQEWERVVFSDECRFTVNSIISRVQVWHPRGQRFDHYYVLQQDAWPSQSVMLWGALIGNRMLGPVVFDQQPGREVA